MTQPERRFIAAPIELRAAKAEGSVGTLVGYAAKYDKYSANLGGFVEVVRRGFFDKSLADKVDVRCRYQHKDDFLLGRTTSGTLVLRSDRVGLLYTADLPDTSVGRDVKVLAQRQDVTGSSFAFIVADEEWGVTEQGFPLRQLVSGLLVDVAPVVEPAYPDTTVAARSLAHAINADPEEIPILMERNEIAERLRKPTVIDLAAPPAEDRAMVHVEVEVCVDTDECDDDMAEAPEDAPASDSPEMTPDPAATASLTEGRDATVEAEARGLAQRRMLALLQRRL